MHSSAIDSSAPFATPVSDVTVELFERRLSESTASPRFAGGERVDYQALVSVRDEDGAIGECLVGRSSRAAAELLGEEIVSFLALELRGRPGSDREWLWSQVPHYVHYERASRQTVAAVDVALWDLAGKRAGLPICDLLGGPQRELPTYLSSAYHDSVDEYAAEAMDCRERGLRGYKPHPGGRPVVEVERLTEAVRAAAGDDLALMLDASLFYSLEEATTIGHRIEGLGYLWFEDPVPWGQEEAFAELGRRLEIPLAATDFIAAEFAELVGRARRDSGLRILRAGARDLGITGLRQATAVAAALGRRCELHIDGSTHMNLANLHVATVAPACNWFETVRPTEWVQWGTKSVVEPDTHGMVRVPAGPGLGVELDRELLDRSRLR